MLIFEDNVVRYTGYCSASTRRISLYSNENVVKISIHNVKVVFKIITPISHELKCIAR